MLEREPSFELGGVHRWLEVCFENARALEMYMNSESGELDMVTIKEETIPHLDKSFPYFMQPIHISGNGVFPVAGEDGEIIEETFGYCHGTAGLHIGFAVLHVEGSNTDSYKVMQKVMVGQSSDNILSTVENNKRIFHYYDLESRMIPLAEMEAVFASYESAETDYSERIDVVNKYSKEFVSTIRSTKFRRLSRSIQQKTIDSLLIQAEQDACIRDLFFTGEPVYCYAPYLSGKQRHFIPMNLENSVISGVCLGIDSIETGPLRIKAIRRDTDLASMTAGLCVVIDPDDDTRQSLGLTEHQVLYIPTHDQSFDVVLYADE